MHAQVVIFVLGAVDFAERGLQPWVARPQRLLRGLGPFGGQFHQEVPGARASRHRANSRSPMFLAGMTTVTALRTGGLSTFHHLTALFRFASAAVRFSFFSSRFSLRFFAATVLVFFLLWSLFPIGASRL
jgi:hypothetical protein